MSDSIMVSLDINTCTVQEACDYVVQQIVAQGNQCKIGGRCTYGNAVGNHCAIGWLLDHSNEGLMEYAGALLTLIDNYRDAVPLVVRANTRVFEKLQSFHDNEHRKPRDQYRKIIEQLEIDTSGEWWDQWVEMGEK